MQKVTTKAGCTFDRIASAGFVILSAIQRASNMIGADLEITAGTNDHVAPDPHYTGEAYDVSVANLSDAELSALLVWLRSTLVADLFTVLFEAPEERLASDARQALVDYVNPEASAPHVHIQRKKDTVYGQ